MRILFTLILLLFSIGLKAPPFESSLTHDRCVDYNFLQQEQMIKNLLCTIRMIESSDCYTKRGLSGEYGAYQFTRATWKCWCIKTIGYTLDLKNPEHQDIIAEQKVRYLLYYEKLTIDQIAAYWNSGRIEYAHLIGVNKHGVKYNVPQYVNKFLACYETI